MENKFESKDIVKAAWKNSGLSQQMFAKIIHKSQPMLSKYIAGSVLPPADVLILCMNKCGLLESTNISAQALAKRVQSELSGIEYSGARIAINQIIDSISTHHNDALLNS